MEKAFWKDLRRTVRRSKGRFLAIFGIVALGAGFLAGLNATSPHMHAAVDTYYDEHRFMDVRMLSDVGFSEDDIRLIAQTPGLEGIMPGYTADTEVRYHDSVLALRVHSLPRAQDAQLNGLLLVEGRMPENSGECVVGALDDFTEGFSIGDTLTLEDASSFTQTDFVIVGRVQSPYYLSFSLGTTSVGRGILDQYAYIPAQDFAQEVYTDLHASVAGVGELDTFSDAYTARVEAVTNALKNITPAQDSPRYEKARQELDDAWDEYREAKADAERELADAEQELTDGSRTLEESAQKLTDGRTEYEDGVDALARARAQYAREIADAEKKLADAQTELADGRQKLADGRRELDDGWAALEKAEAEASDGFAEAEQTLADAKKELDDGEAALKKGREELEAGKAELDAALSALTEAEAKLEAGEAAYAEGAASLAAGRAQYEEALAGAGLSESMLSGMIAGLEAQLATLTPGTPEYLGTQAQIDGLHALEATGAQLAAGEAKLAESRAELDAGRSQLDAARKEAAAALDAASTELAAGEQALQDAERKLNEGKAEYARGVRLLAQKRADAEQELADARTALEDGERDYAEAVRKLQDGETEYEQGLADLAQAKLDAQKEFDDAQAKLTNAQAELEDGERKLAEGRVEWGEGYLTFQREREDALRKLSDAEQELLDAEEDIAKLKDPTWYVLSREENTGYVSLSADAERMASIATVFPLFFFLVAALVALTTMTRMVEEERVLIGTFKALGYSDGTIASKYLLYAALPATAGGAAGVWLGFQVIPTVIWNAYRMMYAAPAAAPRFYPAQALIAIIASVVCTLAATYAACRATLRETPAALMTPPAPRPGQRILLERIRPLWSRLSFTHKVTARNLFRYKRRLFMTIIGIAGCTALLLTGFGLRDSVSAILEKQYNDLYRYDLTVELKRSRIGSNTEAILSDTGLTENYLPIEQRNTDVFGEDKSSSAYLVVPRDDSILPDMVNLRTRRAHHPVSFGGDGVVVTEKLSRQLGIGIGDEIRVEIRDGEEASFTVSGITENYLYHFVYIPRALYERVSGKEVEYNQIVVRTTGPDSASLLSERLRSSSEVSVAVLLADTTETFSYMLRSLDTVMLVLILSAGALAFIVLYNLTNINITERRRELATIRVLGFYDREVGAYIYREILLLTLMGCVAGFLLGIGMHAYVVRTAEIDMMMFGREIGAASYIWSGALTILFSVIVCLIMYGPIRQVDMVESLKSTD